MRTFLRRLYLNWGGLLTLVAIGVLVAAAMLWPDDQTANHVLPYIFWTSFIILTTIVYFVPSIVAFRHKRRHHQAPAILALNLFLGWTLLGWVGALVWALARAAPTTRVARCGHHWRGDAGRMAGIGRRRNNLHCQGRVK